MSSEFDPVADSYADLVTRSVAFSGRDTDHFARRKADALIRLAARRVGEPTGLRALDVGCGIGMTDRYLAPHFGELHGIDTAPQAVELAAATNPSVHYRSYNGERLPYTDGDFDVAFAICVLHHVPPPQWDAFAGEMARVVRPGGIVAVFEHNPRNPLTRLAVSRCEFDEDAVLLGRRRAAQVLEAAGLDVIERRYIIFLPFGGQRVERMEGGLAWLPLGAQHYVAGRRPA